MSPIPYAETAERKVVIQPEVRKLHPGSLTNVAREQPDGNFREASEMVEQLAMLREEGGPVDERRLMLRYAAIGAACKRRAPSPDDVLRQGAALGCRAALLDTFHKNGQGLLNLWTLSETADFVAAAREVGMLTVLAGSLTPEAIDRLRPLEPDYVAVRGAVCDGARDGTLVEGKVAALAARMHGPSVSSA